LNVGRLSIPKLVCQTPADLTRLSTKYVHWLRNGFQGRAKLGYAIGRTQKEGREMLFIGKISGASENRAKF
jgi:hypothetical protein